MAALVLPRPGAARGRLPGPRLRLRAPRPRAGVARGARRRDRDPLRPGARPRARGRARAGPAAALVRVPAPRPVPPRHGTARVAGADGARPPARRGPGRLVPRGAPPRPRAGLRPGARPRALRARARAPARDRPRARAHLRRRLRPADPDGHRGPAAPARERRSRGPDRAPRRLLHLDQRRLRDRSDRPGHRRRLLALRPGRDPLPVPGGGPRHRHLRGLPLAGLRTRVLGAPDGGPARDHRRRLVARRAQARGGDRPHRRGDRARRGVRALRLGSRGGGERRSGCTGPSSTPSPPSATPGSRSSRTASSRGARTWP